MTKGWAFNAILSFFLTIGISFGQGSAPATIAPKAEKADSNTETKIPKEETEPQSAGTPKPAKPKFKPESDEPIVTEIYADKTVFDSTKSIGIFTGHVVVTDPRFNIQGDSLTVYISKKQN